MESFVEREKWKSQMHPASHQEAWETWLRKHRSKTTTTTKKAQTQRVSFMAQQSLIKPIKPRSSTLDLVVRGKTYVAKV